MIFGSEHKTIVEALESLYPGAEWVLDAQDLRFCDGNEHREPTESEALLIQAHIADNLIST